MSPVKLLRKIALFRSLKDSDLARLESCLVKCRYSAGEVVFHMGDEGGRLYIIERGRVRVAIPSPSGDEFILAILSGGEILGELSLFDGKPRSATVQALEETEALCLHRKDLLDLIGNRSEVAVHLLEVLARRLRKTDVSLAETHFLDITARLARKIQDLGSAFGIREGEVLRLGVKMTQKDLASMMGVTRESVNKQLKMLRNEGIIRIDSGYIEILDPVGLEKRTLSPDGGL